MISLVLPSANVRVESLEKQLDGRSQLQSQVAELPPPPDEDGRGDCQTKSTFSKSLLKEVERNRHTDLTSSVPDGSAI